MFFFYRGEGPWCYICRGCYCYLNYAENLVTRLKKTSLVHNVATEIPDALLPEAELPGPSLRLRYSAVFVEIEIPVAFFTET